MLKIMGVGRGRAAAAAADGSDPATRKRKPCEIRMQKELEELELPPNAKLHFPNKDDLLNFEVTITPDEGYWMGASYKFTFNIGHNYPHEPPKVLCETKILHPNIDLDGKVCLNILREEWKPVLSTSAIVFGLLFLFMEPNPNDPLNKEAAALLRDDKETFKRNVFKSLRGETVDGVQFPKLL